jgi:hypothetical protein
MAKYTVADRKIHTFGFTFLSNLGFTNITPSCMDKFITNEQYLRVVDFDEVYLVEKPSDVFKEQVRMKLHNIDTKDKLTDLIILLINKKR